jgi:hypothetical protein
MWFVKSSKSIFLPTKGNFSSIFVIVTEVRNSVNGWLKKFIIIWKIYYGKHIFLLLTINLTITDVLST